MPSFKQYIFFSQLFFLRQRERTCWKLRSSFVFGVGLCAVLHQGWHCKLLIFLWPLHVTHSSSTVLINGNTWFSWLHQELSPHLLWLSLSDITVSHCGYIHFNGWGWQSKGSSWVSILVFSQLSLCLFLMVPVPTQRPPPPTYPPPAVPVPTLTLCCGVTAHQINASTHPLK